MNRKWIYRAMTAAVAVGGMLLFGAASAEASTQVAAADKPAALVNSGGVTHPVMVQHDPASQLGQLGLPITGGFMHPDTAQPGAAQPGTVYNESASRPEGLPGISTGNPPTNGTKVDVPQLTGAAAPVVKPVQRLAGPAAGPLSGLTGTEAGGPTDLADPSGLPVVGPLLSGATQGQQAPTQQPPAAQPQAPTAQQPTGEVGPTDSNTTESASLPLGSAPLRALPVLGTEDGFTIGQNNKLPTDGLVAKAGSGLGSTVGKLTGGPSLGGLPGTESATEGSPVDSLASGANVGGLPVGDLTSPVTSQLNGLPGQEDGMLSTGAPAAAPTGAAPTGTAPAGSAPANPDQPTNGGAPGLGSNPLSTVTGLVGGLGA
ncbi:hypothetical protein Athai_02470 [Actinocatenispora thailandica]|uniref:Uncharacterized protein n=1 Tax=Actinocatenispora thailandica TaxID=227318 RepID=A0A7R7DJB2_9ACTN|nr:hypothetical protein [Actinocatenispora thailandica]BCJ32744.1 hypothetical protein Athai_02470 [Actinocatenispora thailandica]